ncbi:transglycosylase domain-containing protein [Anaerosphaera multitolerans]|uniref:Penicillin-binding protein n=1 Tax=Anaerosphaera multitolerans TaxID=2487351 RepID=A0A437S6D4_9FIRM|nr:transglycosylase domain-containing protein [Anaerosphaera multitolerans]RVU54562.1 penicillin-binding protein [Anaerosphaera multitolerans]
MKKTQKHRKKSSFYFSSFFKILILTIIMAIVLVGTIFGTYVLAVLQDAPKIDPENYRSQINETSKVYSDNGQLIQTLVLNEFSEYVTLDKIPQNLQNAVIAVEDERFYKHSAVDFKRVIGAFVYNLRTGTLGQGASTITMQLAKNLYTGSQKSVERKLTDVYYAYALESVLSKEQILEAYLNSAGFSKGTVGVQAAAKTFFNKDVSELSLAESALVAGITNRPEKYSPYNSEYITAEDNLENIQLVLTPVSEEFVNSEETLQIAENLHELGKIDSFELSQIQQNQLTPVKAVFNPTSKERQELILDLMLKQKYITKEEHDEAVNAPIEINLGERKEKGISSFYVDMVKEEVKDILKDLGYTEEDVEKKLYTGGLEIHSSMNVEIQKHMEETVSNTSLFPGTYTNDKGILQPQIGSVLMDPHTGEVKGLIGGRGIAGASMLNRATDPRQPGSSIKPISVYMTAFEDGATIADVYKDSPITTLYPKWNPKNVGSYMGWTTIRNLIKRSSNVGAILVARDIGSDRDAAANKNNTYSKEVDEEKAMEMIMENLENIGVSTLVWPDTPENEDKTYKDSKSNDANTSSLALGGMTRGISPLEMAGAYTPLANEGIYQKPTFVNKIISPMGDTIYEKKDEGKEAMSKENAFILTTALEDVVKSGTGTAANFPNMPIAGKTGTTTGPKEVWFVGYTPYYVCSVFIGKDKTEERQILNTSSSTPARIWKEIMRPIHEDLEDKEFEQPDGVVKKYAKGTGRSDYFVEGTEPHFTNKLYWNAPSESSTKKDSKDDKDKSSDNKSKSSDDKSKDSTKSSKSDNSNYRTNSIN